MELGEHTFQKTLTRIYYRPPYALITRTALLPVKYCAIDLYDTDKREKRHLLYTKTPLFHLDWAQ